MMAIFAPPFQKCESLNANAQLSASKPLTYDDVKSLLKEANNKKKTLQNKLFHLQGENTIQNFQNSIKDSKKLAWIHSESFRNLQSKLCNISGYMDGKLLQAY